MIAAPVRDRVYARLVIDSSGCVLWTGALTTGGYGQIEIAGHLCLVHRVVWELEYGPIPEGIQLDHVWDAGCRRKHCAALAHLEPVTPAENSRRRAALITSCTWGHAYTPQNTYTDGNGKRGCRTCRVDATRRWRARQVA